ncbi:hypothetical protein C8F04DRAFT_1279284 [Mycena alexandri]|uniref:Uncharacterized protein n=1 Tax=Mycena alexandri TaxID=1745969 RepID=A0AAD6RYG8_9AGAR|nr:hypothetical protein C8F04DRAFT_1279284 [Mycena alexandri]
MTQTAGDKARAAIQGRVDRLRRKKHALAQAKFRERNKEALREKAKEAMRKFVFSRPTLSSTTTVTTNRHRAAIKESEEKTKAVREQRREVDAEYRERQRQKQWIKKFGQESFRTVSPFAMIPPLRVPPAVKALPAPPAGFVPCLLRESFGGNFTNHADFSRQGNKTYWVLFSSAREAVYTLKPECVAGKNREDDERDVVASFAEWGEVLRVWGAFCYHHHGKCEHHANSCRRGCPTHRRPQTPPEPARRDPRVKVEVGVKPERATPKLQTPRRSTSTTGSRARASTRPPSRPSPVEEDDANYMGTVPLYDPDTPPPRRARSASIDVPLYVRTPPPQPSLERDASGTSRSRSSHAPSRAQSPAQTSPPTSTTLSSASSLSASTVTANAPAASGKGKERARSQLPSSSRISRTTGAHRSPWPSTSSVSRTAGAHGATARPTKSQAEARAGTPATVASSSASTSRVIGRNNAFFVSASGLIRDTSAAAFSDIVEGPVKVVMGWEAATKYAVELAEKEATRAASEEEDGMELDD